MFAGFVVPGDAFQAAKPKNQGQAGAAGVLPNGKPIPADAYGKHYQGLEKNQVHILVLLYPSIKNLVSPFEKKKPLLSFKV